MPVLTLATDVLSNGCFGTVDPMRQVLDPVQFLLEAQMFVFFRVYVTHYFHLTSPEFVGSIAMETIQKYNVECTTHVFTALPISMSWVRHQTSASG